MAVSRAFGRVPVFLIIEKNPLVAEDLAMSIWSVIPEADVHNVRSVAQAHDEIQNHDRVSAAFVGSGQKDTASDLADAVAERGGRMVLVGGRAEVRHAMSNTYAHLEIPFTTEMIVDIVMRLRDDRQADVPPEVR